MWNKNASLSLNLDNCEREARQLVHCTGCYGVGEDRHAPGRACPVCQGSGRAPREPHTIELVALVRQLLAEAAQQRQVARGLDGALLDERHARAEQTDRAFTAEAEAEELRRDLDRVRCELHQLRDDVRQLRATTTEAP